MGAWQVHQDSNPDRMVLETSMLPLQHAPMVPRAGVELHLALFRRALLPVELPGRRNGGASWIRTARRPEGQRFYRPHPLTAWISPHCFARARRVCGARIGTRFRI